MTSHAFCASHAADTPATPPPCRLSRALTSQPAASKPRRRAPVHQGAYTHAISRGSEQKIFRHLRAISLVFPSSSQKASRRPRTSRPQVAKRRAHTAVHPPRRLPQLACAYGAVEIGRLAADARGRVGGNIARSTPALRQAPQARASAQATTYMTFAKPPRRQRTRDGLDEVRGDLPRPHLPSRSRAGILTGPSANAAAAPLHQAAHPQRVARRSGEVESRRSAAISWAARVRNPKNARRRTATPPFATQICTGRPVHSSRRNRPYSTGSGPARRRDGGARRWDTRHISAPPVRAVGPSARRRIRACHEHVVRLQYQREPVQNGREEVRGHLPPADYRPAYAPAPRTGRSKTRRRTPVHRDACPWRTARRYEPKKTVAKP